jgi:chemotaxis protein methyltransferase CheR
MKDFKKWQKNYLNSGGNFSLSEYVDGHHESIQFKKFLSEGFTVSNHNLVTDSHFAQMELIICKNVLIYFDNELQNRVIGLFYNSLTIGGFLCLGRSESLEFTEYSDKFDLIDDKAKIYRKKPHID